MRKILVSSYGKDAHADAVLWGLRCIGQPAMLWQPFLFPARQALSILVEPGEPVRHAVEAEDGSIHFGDVKTVWNRRSRPPQLSEEMDPRDLEFARHESEQHLDGFLTTACLDSFWVNPPAAARLDTNKPFQLDLARRVGFHVPPTLFTNSPDEVAGFFDRHGGDIVYKSYRPERWIEGEGVPGTFVNHTASVSKEDLADRRVLAMCPGIFQRRIDKDHELRVTMMGDTLFCVRIDDSGTGKGALDWRSDRVGMRLSRCELAGDARAMCKTFMHRAGLVFACFDFIVTPAGELVFLEVNPMGQFLWQEDRIPDLPLLDAMCAFLASADPHFRWTEPPSPLRFPGYRASKAEAANARIVPEAAS